MLLAILVVEGDILLQTVRDGLIVNDNLRVRRERLNDDINDIQQLAAVAAAEAEEGFFFRDLYLPVFQVDIFLQGPVEQNI